MAQTQTERDLDRLAVELKQLEGEYNMYFAGRLPKPPWDTRNRVTALVKQYDRSYMQNTGDRFRFSTLQARYAAFIDLWDRGLRAREEGRPGPFAQSAPKSAKPKRPEAKVLHVSAFRDPMHEMDKMHDLYNSVADARRELGEEAIPFHKFVDLVKSQVKKLKTDATQEVAFRVAVKDGKVSFTACALKGSDQKD